MYRENFNTRLTHREFSDRQKQQKQNGKWNNNVGESSNRPKYSPYYVKLAPESPLRKSYDILHDESSYDSFHNYETGELVHLHCRQFFPSLSITEWKFPIITLFIHSFTEKSASGVFRSKQRETRLKSCLNMQSALQSLERKKLFITSS